MIFINIDVFFIIIINIDRNLLTKSIVPLNTFSSGCLSQHKLKFWTGICQQKIRWGMVVAGVDS